MELLKTIMSDFMFPRGINSRDFEKPYVYYRTIHTLSNLCQASCCNQLIDVCIVSSIIDAMTISEYYLVAARCKITVPPSTRCM